jgi:hypothetical protein
VVEIQSGEERLTELKAMLPPDHTNPENGRLNAITSAASATGKYDNRVWDAFIKAKGLQRDIGEEMPRCGSTRQYCCLLPPPGTYNSNEFPFDIKEIDGLIPQIRMVFEWSFSYFSFDVAADFMVEQIENMTAEKIGRYAWSIWQQKVKRHRELGTDLGIIRDDGA